MTFRLGIIGAGYLTDVALSAATLNLAGTVDLVAVYDTNPVNLAKVGAVHPSAVLTSNLDEFFAAGLDGVHVASPNDSHACYAQATLNRNIHLLLEKPAAHNPSAAADIAASEQRSSAVCVMGYMFKHAPSYQHALALVGSGRIGQLQAIIGTYPGWRKTDWHAERAASGLGCLTDLGSYPIATATDLLGRARTRIESIGWPRSDQPEAESYAAGTVWYAGGARLQFEVTGVFNDHTPYPAGTSQLTIVGADGFIQLRGVWNMGWQTTLVVHDRSGWDESVWEVPDLYERQYLRFVQIAAAGSVPEPLSIDRGVHDLQLLHDIAANTTVMAGAR